MYTLIAQNKYGQQMKLTHNDAYVIESIEGLDPPDAVINTTRNANADGSVFNSSYVDNRQIVITLAINGPAEDNRIQLYKYFKNKYPVRLYYQNDTRNVYINGYCKSIQIEFFKQKQIAQITIICPEPFFNGTVETITDFSSIQPMFEFPFSVEESCNLIPNNLVTQTKNGVTATNNGDGTITINGTCTANTSINYTSNVVLSAGTYILTGCPEGGSNSTYRLAVTSFPYDYGEGSTKTLNVETTVQGWINVYQGQTYENLVFSPMVRAASIEDPDFMEYGKPPGEIEFGEILIEQEKDILNAGDVETGAELYLIARGPLTNPTIYNAETNEFFKLNISMIKGDEIYINTKKKQKQVTLTRNGATTNIIGNLVNGSTWFVLNPGDNIFTTTAETNPENLDAYCLVIDQYEGV
jgi:predicted phage tail component-like protein